MKVILLQDIRGKGKKGQMIEASDGYARNFLLPRKMAVEATADNVNTMKMNDKAKAEQQAREKAQAQEFAQQLKDITVEIPAKAGSGGRLFGSITSAEVSEALKKQFGIAIDKKKIVQDEPIRSFGTFTLKAKLGYEIVATITVHVSEG
jgi:large subunit ribosomal protein L9